MKSKLIVEGDKIEGDKIEGDKVEGDKISIYLSTSEEDYGIIEDIFKGVLENRRENTPVNKKFSLTKLNRKIEINFEQKFRTFVSRYYETAYIYIPKIEYIFTQFSPDDQNDIHADISDKYIRYLVEGKSSFEIMLKLFDAYIPTSKKDNPKYKNISKAMILFFFEDCTWGEKLEEE